MTLFGQGRKMFLAVFFMLQGLGIMAASYFLALQGKLGTEWVQLVTIWLPIAGVVTGAYQASNAYVSGKALAAGQETEP